MTDKINLALDYFPYATLAPIAILLALLPFAPQPHLVEKLIMLKNGTLAKPIDIFDLLMHGTPLALLMAKAARDYLIR
ncbi:MAG: hypothetical protein OEZ55_05465 [Nitrospinota bacterium]|nr:hypothetical protein [Nitrospinota bacterium]MDH5756097.1 hypothetical protein [Nitrospinota bacterium]